MESQRISSIQSPFVKSRLQKLPLLESAIVKDQSIPVEEVYLEKINGTYKGQVTGYAVPNGYGQLFFDNGDYLEGIF